MKIILLLAALLLCCTPAFGRGKEKLPLAQRISDEKLILAEKYQQGSQKCRERSRKRAKESCFEQKKKEFLQNVADLENNPRAYFTAKEKNSLDRKTLQELKSQ